MAKTSAYATWKPQLVDEKVNFEVKNSTIKVLTEVFKYIQQIFGYGNADIINKLQCFFLERILRLPTFTPTYAIYLEIKELPTSWFALKLHIHTMDYIIQTLFIYDFERLPKYYKTKYFCLKSGSIWKMKCR
ncbi:hypothetical protein ACFFRR_005478 [Megaselia abdita]